MKLLTLHVDYINFKPLKKALKNIADLSKDEKKGGNVKDALVVMTAIEKGDSVADSVNELVKNVKDIAKQIGAENIVLYPYAHLSNNLSKPEDAMSVLDKSEKELSKSFKVSKAPFGYYKEFELKVKGHPLSELSREIRSSEATEETYEVKQLLREISKSKLDTSKLKENDHRILGKQMDLFSFSEVAPGMVFWHNNGLIIYNELIDFWREKHKRLYEEIRTPQIMDSKLWKVSGHWDKYKKNNFTTNYEGRPFLIKPMNCPGGMMVYKNSPKSYKDLPLRVGEIGTVHRQELSGVLAGLFRAIQFTQDDAHIFCTEKQIEEEIRGVINLIQDFYKVFKLEFDHIELSTRPEKRIGSDKSWDMAEGILENVLKENKIKYKINKGDGAFYGPKIDFHVKDSLGRTWQTSTIQLDFALPERFELEYIDKDNKRKQPIMLHRVIYGAVERFLGILLEHTNGRLPTWLAPTQVRVVSFTDKNVKYAEKTVEQLANKIPNLRIDADFRNTTIQAKVKDAELMRIPYIIVIGSKEEESGELAIRTRGEKKIINKSLEDFSEELRKEIVKRL